MQLGPETTEICLEHLHGLFQLRFDVLPQLHLDVHLKIALPSFATPDHLPGPPKRKPCLKQFCAPGSAIPAGLFHSADQTGHLSLRLPFTRFKKMIYASEACLIARDNID